MCTSGSPETESQPPEGDILEEVVSNMEDFLPEVMSLETSYTVESRPYPVSQSAQSGGEGLASARHSRTLGERPAEGRHKSLSK